MNEEWMPLKYNGFNYGDFYHVSNYGNIKNIKTQRILNPSISKVSKYKEYFTTCVRFNKKSNSIYVHKAVLESFKGLKDFFHIDHIDGNTLNNKINNLQWLSIRENTSKRINKSKTGTGIQKTKSNKFQCVIWHNDSKKRLALGRYNNIKSAKEAYEIALKSINDSVQIIYDLIDNYRLKINLKPVKRRNYVNN